MAVLAPVAVLLLVVAIVVVMVAVTKLSDEITPAAAVVEAPELCALSAIVTPGVVVVVPVAVVSAAVDVALDVRIALAVVARTVVTAWTVVVTIVGLVVVGVGSLCGIVMTRVALAADVVAGVVEATEMVELD